MRPDQLERRIRERLDAPGPAPRAELLNVPMLPDFDRADRIGEFWGYPESREFVELLIDCEGGQDTPSGAGRDVAGRRPPAGSVRDFGAPRAGRSRMVIFEQVEFGRP